MSMWRHRYTYCPNYMIKNLCVGDVLLDPSQVSKAAGRRFSCSPMKTISFTSKLWMRLEPVNRARLHSFPPEVTRLTLNTPFDLLFVCNSTQIHFHIVSFRLACYCFQGQSSTCWKPQLIPLWSCQWTRPPCTTLTMHLQTDSERQSAPATLWTAFAEPV